MEKNNLLRRIMEPKLRTVNKAVPPYAMNKFPSAL